MDTLTSASGIIYASIALPQEQGFARLEQAIIGLLDSVGEQPVPRVLWNLRYVQRGPVSGQGPSEPDDGVIILSPLSMDLAFDDFVLEEVKKAWQTVTGEPEESFLKFEAREGMESEDFVP